MTDHKGMQILTEEQVVNRLRERKGTQIEMARDLHCSRTFVNQVLTSRKSRPTDRMLDMVGVEKKTVYVVKGTFPKEYELPQLKGK